MYHALYTIAEISNLIKVSKVSIYKKLKLKELKPHILKKQGITYVDEIGFNLIKDSFNLNDEIKIVKNEVKSDEKEEFNSAGDVEIAIDTELLSLKNDYINELKEENKKLWEQINRLNERLKGEQELHRNTQVLFKNNQDKKVLELQALEEHFKDLDNRLLKVREKMEKRKENSKKNIFYKIRQLFNANKNPV